YRPPICTERGRENDLRRQFVHTTPRECCREELSHHSLEPPGEDPGILRRDRHLRRDIFVPSSSLPGRRRAVEPSSRRPHHRSFYESYRENLTSGTCPLCIRR